MAQSAPLLARSLVAPAATEASPRASSVTLSTTPLDGMALGEAAEVVSLRLEPDTVAWLRAVGIGEGDQVVVLRRAVFGGPLHVRTGAGGEFALNRSLAREILVRAADAASRDAR